MAITVSSTALRPKGEKQFQELYTVIPFSATLVVASIADGATDSGTITVTGAGVGDVVIAELTTARGANVNLDAFVSAADTVTVFVNNESGGAYTSLASPGKTVKGVVLKPKFNL